MKSFIFIQGACGTHKTHLKILDSDFTYYGVYSFSTFGVRFLFNYSKTSFKKSRAIENVIWHILTHLFGYFLGYLAEFEVRSGMEKTRDSSYYVITHHKDDYFQWKSNLKIINYELFFEISSDLSTKLWFSAPTKTVVLILKTLAGVFLKSPEMTTRPPGGYFSERPPES